MPFTDLKSRAHVQIACQLARETGVPMYLVGGAVRDAMTGGFLSGDCDFAVAGRFDEIVSAFAGRVKGHAIPWDFSQTRVVYRTAAAAYESVDFAMLKAPDIDGDLRLRDFTINAMAVDLRRLWETGDPALIDPLSGRQDIQNKIVRMCSSRSFDDDPLRMLRAVRFARQLGYTIDFQTFSQCAEKHGLITTVSIERIKKELFTILNFPGQAASLSQLMHMGFMGLFLPQLADWADIAQCPPHQHNLLEHSLLTVERLAGILDSDAALGQATVRRVRRHLDEELEEGVTRRALLVFTALLHDSGKPGAAQELDGTRHFHGHDLVGSRINKAIAERLGLGRRCRRMIELATANHMRLLQLSLLDQPTERAARRLLHDCGDMSIEVLLLALADMMATSSDPDYLTGLEHARALATELLDKALDPYGMQDDAQLLTGRDIMDELGVDEGPHVGKLLQELHRAEREGRVSTREEAIAWLKALKD
jgi:tRNA nucleotidyltransferase/poly(A) polymerase